MRGLSRVMLWVVVGGWCEGWGGAGRMGWVLTGGACLAQQVKRWGEARGSEAPWCAGAGTFLLPEGK